MMDAIFQHENSQMISSSSAPRLNFSSQDIFNLRNHNLSQISRSAIGIHNSVNKEEEPDSFLNNIQNKGILKKDEDSSSRKSETFHADIGLEENNNILKLFPAKIQEEIQFTVFVVVCFIFLILVPLSMIVIGITYFYSCTAQPKIPIYLTVAGSAFLIFIFIFKKLKRLANENEYNESFYSRCIILAVLLQVGWFIAGCYWIYKVYAPDYNDVSSTFYCHKVLYQYAFWFVNSVFLGLLLFLISFVTFILFGRPKNHEITVHE